MIEYRFFDSPKPAWLLTLPWASLPLIVIFAGMMCLLTGDQITAAWFLVCACLLAPSEVRFLKQTAEKLTISHGRAVFSTVAGSESIELSNTARIVMISSYWKHGVYAEFLDYDEKTVRFLHDQVEALETGRIRLTDDGFVEDDNVELQSQWPMPEYLKSVKVR